jgi:dihydrofolate reductase
VNNVTLDGVMQAPGRPDEDRCGGFRHGGWAMPYNDAVKGSVMAQGMARPSALLFGRRTYEDFFRVWPGRKDNPFSEVLDNTRKYVASTSLKEPLPWRNSTLLRGDAADAVAELKATPGEDLVDRFVLLVHPLVLGEGRRLFQDGGAFVSLRLIASVPTTTGAIIATYESTNPAGTPA